VNQGVYGFPVGQDFPNGLLGLPPRLDSLEHTGPPITDYVGWWDSSDYSSLTIVSNLITQWNDLTGSGNHFIQTSASLQPSYGSRKINGIVVPDFDGSSDYMTGGLSVGAPATVFWVGEPDSLGTLNMWGTVPNGLTGRINPSGQLSTLKDGVAGITLTTAAMQVGQPVVCVHTADGSVGVLRQNETWLSQAFAQTPVAGGFSIGSRNGAGSAWWDGALAEFFCYDRILTTEEISSMVDYLSQKWGVG